MIVAANIPNEETDTKQLVFLREALELLAEYEAEAKRGSVPDGRLRSRAQAALMEADRKVPGFSWYGRV